MPTDKHDVHLFTCQRCGKRWQARKEGTPKKCPACQNPNWQTPRLTAQQIIGPAPPGVPMLADQRMLFQVRTIQELRSLTVDALDALNWTAEAATEVQKQIRRAQLHVATGLDIAERILGAAKAPYLPPAHAVDAQPPEPSEKPQQPPTVAPEAKDTPDQRSETHASKPTPGLDRDPGPARKKLRGPLPGPRRPRAAPVVRPRPRRPRPQPPRTDRPRRSA